MRLKSARRRALLGGLAAVSAAAALVVTGTPAFAAIGNHRVQLCAQGNYAADITWSTTDHSLVVPRGECKTFDIDGTGAFKIGGFYNVSQAHFQIVTVFPEVGGYNSDSPGSKWGAEGTTTAPHVKMFQNI
jgi:hypothetical protein